MTNPNFDINELLRDQRVVDEINRHLWIESEKAGFDIGFEKAKEDWLEKFSKAWIAYHMPEKLNMPKAEQPIPLIKKSEAAKEAAELVAKRSKRRAKSYL